MLERQIRNQKKALRPTCHVKENEERKYRKFTEPVNSVGCVLALEMITSKNLQSSYYLIFDYIRNFFIYIKDFHVYAN